MKDGWQQMSAAALGRGIGMGEIDPVELAEGFLDAINAHEHSETIYTCTPRRTPFWARARAALASERARSGVVRG